MKRSLVVFSMFLLVMSVVATGCSRVQKVIATQEGMTASYESLGVLEVNRKAPSLQCKRFFGKILEWVTFGHYKNVSQEVYLQRLLDKKLIKDAKKTHHAERVINVKYWPDLKAKKFPQGLIYAKGEMVRYKRFAE